MPVPGTYAPSASKVAQGFLNENVVLTRRQQHPTSPFHHATFSAVLVIRDRALEGLYTVNIGYTEIDGNLMRESARKREISIARKSTIRPILYGNFMFVARPRFRSIQPFNTHKISRFHRAILCTANDDTPDQPMVHILFRDPINIHFPKYHGATTEIIPYTDFWRCDDHAKIVERMSLQESCTFAMAFNSEYKDSQACMSEKTLHQHQHVYSWVVEERPRRQAWKSWLRWLRRSDRARSGEGHPAHDVEVVPGSRSLSCTVVAFKPDLEDKFFTDGKKSFFESSLKHLSSQLGDILRSCGGAGLVAKNLESRSSVVRG
ncbi:hypothetical protein DFJ58DRAFT_843320 [Suillus subalutaceus]|uniref:uncharacterized protein n=1 Tax=Suillus subalutaceus TaxID=48586 RepID=UPI001B85E44A|nr:uncharacterized protein DFJ58DRAFT_843320 [Suillus subalutaceus]KAG1847004.1 hypothetical protein DFJ58DRAFT_843320 [Suillus subalutaceus]